LIETYKNPINKNKAENSDDKFDLKARNIFDLIYLFQTYMRYHWVIYIKFYEVRMINEMRIANEKRKINPILTRFLKIFFKSPEENSV